MPVEITLQYFEGCPHWELADRDLKEAIRLLHLDTEIHYQRIESQDEAVKLQFRGSPTILISARDPFAEPDAPVGLSCRVYRTAAGAVSGTPGLAALQQELVRVGTGSSPNDPE